jgi:hypothetical protein
MAGQVCLVLYKDVLPEGRGIRLRDGLDGPVCQDVVNFLESAEKIFTNTELINIKFKFLHGFS